MHNMFGVDFWITSANLLYLASYSVRDILWLRVLTVVAAVLLIPYYYLQPTPLWIAIGWNVLFTGINLYWIVRLMFERHPVRLTDDERQIQQLCFPRLSAADVAGICKMGSWQRIEAGTCLVEHDRSQGQLSAILSGKADVWMGAEKVAELGAGQFVGQIAYITGDKATINVVARESMRTICWPRPELDAYLERRPDVALLLAQSVGTDLVHLLQSSWQQPHHGDSAA